MCILKIRKLKVNVPWFLQLPVQIIHKQKHTHTEVFKKRKIVNTDVYTEGRFNVSQMQFLGLLKKHLSKCSQNEKSYNTSKENILHGFKKYYLINYQFVCLHYFQFNNHPDNLITYLKNRTIFDKYNFSNTVFNSYNATCYDTSHNIANKDL